MIAKLSYRKVSCCHNCSHCFHMTNIDDPTYLYCAFKAPKRPLCGNHEESFVMWLSELCDNVQQLTQAKKESLKKKQKRILRERIKAWDKWSKNREVDPDRICDNYKAKSKILTLKLHKE